MRYFASLATLALAFGLASPAAQNRPLRTPSADAPPPPTAGPTIDDLIALKRPASPAISPDGRHVAYVVREANWDENAYENEIWVADVARGTAKPLTHAKKSSLSPAWSPDGRRIAFISDRTDKRQIYVIGASGGEAERITSLEEGVNAFAWSPDGSRIAFTVEDSRSDAIKARDKKYGEFEIVDRDQRMTQLHVIEVATREVKPVTSNQFVVGSFDWSPDGRQIVFDHRVNGQPAQSGTANISIVSLADGRVRPLVTQNGPDTRPVWSPDGRRIAFNSAMGDPAYYYKNVVIATIDPAGGAIEPLTVAFDENASLVAWTPAGIYFSAPSRTWSYLYRLDPATKKVTRRAPADRWIGSSFSVTRGGDAVAALASDPTHVAEVYAGPIDTMALVKLTAFHDQTAAWPQSARDVITWKSRDGVTIEGVLHKPATLEPGRRYPLLVVIHGGPTGTSRPIPFNSTSYYPIDVWLTRGAIVLEPNYRGSAGYGEKFRSLNVRNLGIGDAWDVISGVDALVAQGLADKDRVGVMGWSQGGYISAFLATHDSTRFKAISVGAGISDWMTYYVNTDIHPFTRQYLKSTPWDDPEIYRQTSPITYIKGARTPTLIQHGELDRRVPIPNAYELYQGLQDQNVPVKLVVYKGFGHGLNKPKANRAAMEHNVEWFDQYIFKAPAAGPTAPGRLP